jgi:NTP pyrophosphatase (non-canonical NTP hydrolase)
MQVITQSFSQLEKQIAQWAYDRNLIDGSTPKDQMHKLFQEVGELSADICKGKDPRDELGDVFVVAVILCTQLGVKPEECIEVAYEKIKNRRGVMRDGVFIKEGDL